MGSGRVVDCVGGELVEVVCGGVALHDCEGVLAVAGNACGWEDVAVRYVMPCLSVEEHPTAEDVVEEGELACAITYCDPWASSTSSTAAGRGCPPVQANLAWISLLVDADIFPATNGTGS